MDGQDKDSLFELCKKVYELTWWSDGSRIGTMEYLRTPLYTSDYLLEKLPVYSDDGEGMLSVTTRQGIERNGWLAYYEDVDGYSVSHEGIGKSALLALLKLTIALSEAGELNND